MSDARLRAWWWHRQGLDGSLRGKPATGKLSRSLGEEGKKKGLSTTLPLALGRMQVRGDVRRVPVNGRLDQQRYLYTLWRPNPRARYTGSTADALTELARRFFAWIGPATLGELQWFTGLGVKASKEAIAPLGLVPCEPGSDRLLLPDDVESFRSFQAPTKAQYALVSGLDSISATRRDVRTLLDADDVERRVQLEKKVGNLGSLSDLPNHAILDRGRLVGLWEYDVDSRSIVHATFGPKDEALDTAVKETEAYVRDQLGDARSFSLDSPKSRAPKIEALAPDEVKRPFERRRPSASASPGCLIEAPTAAAVRQPGRSPQLSSCSLAASHECKLRACKH